MNQEVKTVVDAESRKWGMLCHLSALSGFIIPLGNLIVPLIIWQLKKEGSPFIDEQGKESVNFQLSLLIWVIVGVILCFVFVGVFLLMAMGVASVIFIIIAGIKANEGQSYQYPMNLRFIK